MVLTGRDPPQPTTLSWPCLNMAKYFRNIFKSVASISVECVTMISCSDSASVGLPFYLFSFFFVSIFSELIIVWGVMTFLIFFHIFFLTQLTKKFLE